MKQLIKKRPGVTLALACYVLGLAVLLVSHMAGYIQNRALHADGTLQTVQLTVDDFELIDMVQREDGTLVTTSADPQMLLRDAALWADGVLLDFTYEGAFSPYMVCAYWAKVWEPYATRRMSYAADTQNGYLIHLPAEGGAQLRIDPDTAPGVVIQVNSITLNPPRTLGSFFVPTAGEVAALCVIPGMAACILSVLWQGYKALKDKRGVKHG